MFDLIEFRRILGSHADNLTDKEVKRIMDIGYGFADAIFELWLGERNSLSTVMVPNTS